MAPRDGKTFNQGGLDVSGSLSALEVVGLMTIPLDTNTPAAGDIYVYETNPSQWQLNTPSQVASLISPYLPGGSYVPYSGATGPVDLNGKNLTDVNLLGAVNVNVNSPRTTSALVNVDTGAPTKVAMSLRAKTQLPSGTAPNGISGLTMWIDPSTLSQGDGTNITSITDRSSNAGVWTPGSYTPPIYKASILNGKPIMRFSTSSLKSTLTTSNYMGAGSSDFTLIIVMNQTNSALASIMACTPISWTFFNNGSTNVLTQYWGGSYGGTAGSGTAGTGWHTFINTYSYAALYKDVEFDWNVLFSSASVSNYAASYTEPFILGTYDGTNFPMNGDIAMVIMYNRALTGTEKTNLQAWLASYFGLPAPGGTPQSADMIDVLSDSGTVLSAIIATGDITTQTAGVGFRVKEGSNAKQGVATLVGGSAVVSNTSVTANSRIQLTIQSLGTVTVPKAVGVTARTAGTSFTITSADATDTSVIAYEIFEPS